MYGMQSYIWIIIQIRLVLTDAYSLFIKVTTLYPVFMHIVQIVCPKRQFSNF